MSPVLGLPPPSVPHVQWPGSFPIASLHPYTLPRGIPAGLLFYPTLCEWGHNTKAARTLSCFLLTAKKHVNLVRHSSTIVHTVHLYNFTTYHPENYSIYYTLYFYMLDVLSIYSVHSAHPVYIYTHCTYPIYTLYIPYTYCIYIYILPIYIYVYI